MSDWWLKNIFDAYDKSRQKVEDIGTFTAESMLSIYNGAKIVLKEAVNKDGNDEYIDNLSSDWGVEKLYTPVNGTSPYDTSFLEKIQGILQAPMFRVGAGLITVGLVVYATKQFAIPSLPLRVSGDKEVLLVVGEMSDPITRSLVYDMYRRGFCVFICSTREDKERSLEEEYEKIPSPWDREDGLFHINSSVTCLTRFLEHLEQENKRLRGIVVIPNVSYYTSGVFMNHSTAHISSELNTNFMNIWCVLTKLLPHFSTSHKDRLKIVVFNPSLSKNLNLHYHSLELIISSLMDSLYRIMSNECGQVADVYQCNLGVLNVAGNASNYKYLCVSGTPITKSLCEPIYELLMSTDSIWFRFKRWLLGPILFCGKGAWVTCYLKNWAPVWLLEMI